MAKFSVKDGKLNKNITLYLCEKDKAMSDDDKAYIEYEEQLEKEKLQKEEEYLEFLKSET